jgi:hypothetical protein
MVSRMAAISVTLLSVAFLLASWLGVDRGAPAWLTVPALAMAILCALVVLSAVAADTRAATVERRPRVVPTPPEQAANN